MLNQLDLLIISDLHAHSGDPRRSTAPSYYSTNSVFATPETNPLIEIPALIRKAGLPVDWIVCPGDLSDKADASAQKIAWEHLESIRNEVGAKKLIGTTGNHDIDSRRVLPDFDPKSALQQLIPDFPISLPCYVQDDRVYVDRFWSNNFVIIPFADFDCTLLILNSCAFHGYSSGAKSPPNEHLRGKISPLTLSAIKAAIANLQTRLNVLLVHHHLIKIPYLDDNDSLMIGSNILLDILKSTGKQWFVMHGHEHAPFLMYSDADFFAPVVLSAGSVAAKTWRVKGGHARNQIHHVSIPLSKIEPTGVQVFGQVTSWTWTFETGWKEASGDGGIPYKSGFGYRFDGADMRDRIVAMAQAASPRLLPWVEVLRDYPKLEYIVPPDRDALVSLLKGQGISFEFDIFGVPTRLEWRVA